MTSNIPNLSAAQATDLAGDLLRQLAPDIGNDGAINATMRRWVDVLGTTQFGLVCMAAVQMTFRDCLTHVPIPDIPPGSVAFNEEMAA